jgi:phage FluMu protein Com
MSLSPSLKCPSCREAVNQLDLNEIPVSGGALIHTLQACSCPKCGTILSVISIDERTASVHERWNQLEKLLELRLKRLEQQAMLAFHAKAESSQTQK